MALFKRGKWWWTDFSVNGVRYRQPIRDEHGDRTKDWREALTREKELTAQAQAGKLAASSQQFGRLSFSDAVDRYLSERLPRIQPKTARAEKERARQLKKYFDPTPVGRITADSVLAYVAERKKAGMANGTINRDLDVLRGVLKRAKRWHLMADDIRPLPVRQNIGRALAHDEKLRLLRLAASKSEWQNARLAAWLPFNTAMRAGEIRGLRWRDVDLIERTLSIQRATTKTDAGERVIPLNGGAWAAILELRQRAKLLFGAEPQPDWYVFPRAEGLRNPDPTRPMSGWRTAWRNLTRAIQCPACGHQQRPGETCGNLECKADIRNVKSSLAGLRFHDLRHHAITELAESQTSDQTIMSIAGHVSPKMLAHYSHVRLDAKRKALGALSGGGSGGSYGTKSDTNSPAESIAQPQVIEKVGGREGIRTPGLLVANEALSQLSYSPTSSKEILTEATRLANQVATIMMSGNDASSRTCA
jgi:integrase